jgi:hypothetical protein
MSEPDYLDDDKYIEDYLEIAKQKYEEGDKAVLLMALHQCLLLRKPLPEWLRAAFVRAYESAAAFEIRSWNEAFGPPQGKSTHRQASRRHADLRYPVAFHVHRLRKSGRPIDREMFEAVAEVLREDGFGKIKGSTVEKIYYTRGGKELHAMLQPLFDGPTNS